MKKVILILFFVLLCGSVFSVSYAPEFVKPERLDVPYGKDVNLNLHIGEIVEARVREGTKIYFPIEGVEADFWVNEVNSEYVKGQLSVKGGRYAEKTILRDDLKKSNSLKINVYGGEGADMLIRYGYYHPGDTVEEESVILIFDVFKQVTPNPDGTYDFAGGDILPTGGVVGGVVDKGDNYMTYFYIVIGVLVLVLVYVVFFKKDASEEESSYAPVDDSYIMESESEPVSTEVNLGGHVDSGVVEEKKVRKVSKKKE